MTSDYNYCEQTDVFETTVDAFFIGITPLAPDTFINTPQTQDLWSSRLALYRVSPSTEPDVRLSHIRLLAMFIVQ